MTKCRQKNRTFRGVSVILTVKKRFQTKLRSIDYIIMIFYKDKLKISEKFSMFSLSVLKYCSEIKAASYTRFQSQINNIHQNTN